MTTPLQNPRETIPAKLREIEISQKITILFAVESGSRAWGMASPTSDYDVRFVYVDNPDRMCSVFNIEDTNSNSPHFGKVIYNPRQQTVGNQLFSYMGLHPDLDFSGWNLPKAIRAIRNSNISIYNWLDSSEVYYRHPDAYPILSEFLAQPGVWSPAALAESNLGVCAQEYRTLKEKGNLGIGKEVRIKSLLYYHRHLGEALLAMGKTTHRYTAEIDLLNDLRSEENDSIIITEDLAYLLPDQTLISMLLKTVDVMPRDRTIPDADYELLSYRLQSRLWASGSWLKPNKD